MVYFMNKFQATPMSPYQPFLCLTLPKRPKLIASQAQGFETVSWEYVVKPGFPEVSL